MNFKQAIGINPQLKKIYEHLIIKTSMGREMLFNSEFSTDKEFLLKQYSLTKECQRLISYIKDNDKMLLECVLYDIHNIKGSISIIKNGDVLDDIGLFEVKAFCLSCKEISEKTKMLKSSDFKIENLDDIISILDPEHTKTKQFYIYNAYDESLSPLRKEFEDLKLKDDIKATEIYNQIIEKENVVRENLCSCIRPHTQRLLKAIDKIALLDISIAKAELNIALNLTMPQLNDKKIMYHNMFNPIIKEVLNQKGKDFQPIDITLNKETMLITGANMAGKTVILKTLALNQLMIQFGFFAACEDCSVCLVNNVLTSIGDKQNDDEGLSSFASEILTLNGIIKLVKSQKRYLVLADELARTTNPVEGIKLLNGFITTINQGNSFAVITTHYSNISAQCRHMRVKGFKAKGLIPPISIANLADNIDYSLEEDDTNQAANEAINLCRLLAIDSDWLSNCK